MMDQRGKIVQYLFVYFFDLIALAIFSTFMGFFLSVNDVLWLPSISAANLAQQFCILLMNKNYID